MVEGVSAVVSRALLVLGVLSVLTSAGCGFINDIDGPNGLAIKKFAVSPREVVRGAASTLSWEVEGAESIQIDNGIGVVSAKGALEVRVERNTSYNITARAGSSSATASVQLLVGPGSTPSPSPTPAPTPTPTPSPTPSPNPTPSPSPTPRPSPSVTSACGASVESVQGCSVRIQRQRQLPYNECIEITRLALSQGCPMAMGAARAISFDVMAETELRELRWLKAAGSRDGLEPGDGRLIRRGATTAIATQTVQESALTIQIISEGTSVLTFTVRNQ